MKKLLLILLLFPLKIHAYDFELDGCGYKVISMTERTVELVILNEREMTGEFVVPETIMFSGLEYKVTSIGLSAFAGSKLNKITVSNNILEIEGGAFQSCKNLTEFIWPESVEIIKRATFYDCSNLRKVVLPPTLKAIEGPSSSGHGAFENCISLEEIELPNNLQELGGQTFAYCHSLKTIDWPNSLTIIPNKVFYHCGLISIGIPDSIVMIGNEAFSGCSRLAEVTISDSSKITRFGYHVFYDTAIAHINMPINLRIIDKAWYESDYWPFSSELKSISLPNVINTMNNGCYRNYELEKVYSRNRNPEAISENAFHINTLLNGVLYVPEGMVDVYKNLDGWKLFRNIQEYSPTGIEIISNDAQDSSILYDLSGKRVSEGYVIPGLYIKNKRKVLIK